MLCNYFRNKPQYMTFKQLHDECISAFGSRVRKPKVGASASVIQSNTLDKPVERKSSNLVRKEKEK